jgi:hypothetical protein
MKTRVIPTQSHGILDYVVGSALMAAPGLLKLDNHTAAAQAPRAMGFGTTAYGAATDYELGARRVVPMPLHLAADAAGGLVLAATPWLTKDAQRGARYWVPHALIGGSEVLLAATTQTKPHDEQTHSRAARIMTKALAKAPGSPKTKAQLMAKAAGLGARAARMRGKASTSKPGRMAIVPGAVAKAPGSVRTKGKAAMQAAQHKASSTPPAPVRAGIVGLGIARELAGQKR